MQSQRREIRDVLILAQGLVYFIFIGAGTVAIAVAAHLHGSPAWPIYHTR
ncbi:MAG TPA: hypothetical protein VHX17_00265 [Candidatus Cybelea sp.]|nr:hypothetical protein [Candidatus Cybelea sp.]